MVRFHRFLKMAAHPQISTAFSRDFTIIAWEIPAFIRSTCAIIYSRPDRRSVEKNENNS